MDRQQPTYSGLYSDFKYSIKNKSYGDHAIEYLERMTLLVALLSLLTGI
jgi:hypothetical protein